MSLFYLHVLVLVDFANVNQLLYPEENAPMPFWKTKIVRILAIGFGIYLCIGIAVGIFQSLTKEDSVEISATVFQQRRAEAIRKAQDTARSDFEKNRKLILAELSALSKTGHYLEAAVKAEKYLLTDDSELLLEYKKANKGLKNIFMKHPFFGDWGKAKKIRRAEKTTLRIWKPYLEYVNSSAVIPIARDAMLRDNTELLEAEYDEIWEREKDDLLTESEKSRFAGQMDILKFYFKGDAIQAFTIEKPFAKNPANGNRLSTTSYEITQIYNRQTILRHLNEK